MRYMIKMMMLLFLLPDIQSSPLPQVEPDTGRPVILEDGDTQYAEDQEDSYIQKNLDSTQYLDYTSLVEQELKDIHLRLFTSQGSNDTVPIPTPTSDIAEIVEKDPGFVYEPPGVEVTLVVSSSPQEDAPDEEEAVNDNGGPVEADRAVLAGEVQEQDSNSTALKDNYSVQENSMRLELLWWQLLLVVVASIFFAVLCSYFSGCCFLVLDCASDPYWGCCPCSQKCVRMMKPPPHGGSSSKASTKERKAPSRYSLNENNTAPRASLEPPSRSSLIRAERSSTRSLDTTAATANRKSVNGRGSSVVNEINGSGVVNVTSETNGTNGTDRTNSTERASSVCREGSSRPERSLSRDSVVIRMQTSTPLYAQNDSLPTSETSVRNYSRRTSGNQEPRGLGRNDSFRASTRGLDLIPSEGTYGRRKISTTSSFANGDPSTDWVYEDSSGYFSWISKLGGKKKRYRVVPRKPQNPTSQKHIYRQSKYHHIAESRNSAVIPVKISKRASTASNYNVRPLKARSRSVESVESEDEALQPILQTKSERHLPSRLSSNLADLERRHRRQSGCSTPVACPVAPDTAALPGEKYNLQYFEKSLLRSKETTL